MAALSVQYSNAGINVFHCCFSPITLKALRKPLLADTPPARQIFLTPVVIAAFLSLFSKMETMRDCMEAQMSARLLSMNDFLSASVAENGS